MGRPVVIIITALAVYLTLYRGAVVAFVTLYLPALLLLNTTQKINLPGLPDMNVSYGIIYGIVGGLVLKGGEPFPFRWSMVDTLMMLCTLSTVVTGMTTRYVYTGVSIFGEQFLGYLMPYFLARVMFHSAEMRRRALWICVVCAFIIAFFALIEMRLQPYFLSRLLKGVGLFTGPTTQVLYRFGLARAQTSFDHPIDMGNACILLTVMIGIFAMTTSVGVKNFWVWLSMCAAFCSSLSSFSFTSWVGIAATIAMFTTLWVFSFMRRAVILFVVVLFCGFAYMTVHLVNVDVDKRREQAEEVGQTVQDSMFVRAMIVQHSMPFASTAGFFGWGDTIRHSQLALESVDNSYMLFTMRRGFVFMTLFLMLPVAIAVRATRAFRRAHHPALWMPLAAGVSVICGIMAAMYTVWFGFAYSVLWTMMFGLVTSMCDVLQYGPPARQAIPTMGQPVQVPRGFAMARGM